MTMIVLSGRSRRVMVVMMISFFNRYEAGRNANSQQQRKRKLEPVVSMKLQLGQ